MAITLRSGGLAVATNDVSKPKQTDATRRWKVPILAKGQSDVFDLDLLLRGSPSAPRAVDAETRRAAAERGLELPYGAFADQVLPFLDPEVADLYDETTWLQMQSSVIDKLLEEDR